MDYAHPALIGARRVGQKLGLLRPAQRLYRRLFRIDYEAAFDRAMLGEIRSGDCVWDVGANVGFYTDKFALAVGPSGRVVAFEPAPDVHATLIGNVGGAANVTVHQVALSDAAGQAGFDPHGHHHVGRLSEAGPIRVSLRRGDEFQGQTPPDVIKIDVEGFEVEVLRGMPVALARARAVFVEVHFSELMGRGRPTAPAKVTGLLQDAGLAVRWVDASHIAALRPAVRPQ